MDLQKYTYALFFSYSRSCGYDVMCRWKGKKDETLSQCVYQNQLGIIIISSFHIQVLKRTKQNEESFEYRPPEEEVSSDGDLRDSTNTTTTPNYPGNIA